jgi:hypothetical protein
MGYDGNGTYPPDQRSPKQEIVAHMYVLGIYYLVMVTCCISSWVSNLCYCKESSHWAACLSW